MTGKQFKFFQCVYQLFWDDYLAEYKLPKHTSKNLGQHLLATSRLVQCSVHSLHASCVLNAIIMHSRNKMSSASGKRKSPILNYDGVNDSTEKPKQKEPRMYYKNTSFCLSFIYYSYFPQETPIFFKYWYLKSDHRGWHL